MRSTTLLMTMSLLLAGGAFATAHAASEDGPSSACLAALEALRDELLATPHTVAEATSRLDALDQGACAGLADPATANGSPAQVADVAEVGEIDFAACSGSGIGTVYGYATILGANVPLVAEPAAGVFHRFGGFAFVQSEGPLYGLTTTPVWGHIRLGVVSLTTTDAAAGVSCGWSSSILTMGPVACEGAGAARFGLGSIASVTAFTHLVNPVGCGAFDTEVLATLASAS